MKDNELRELLASIERKITATGATIVGDDPKDWLDRLERIERKLDYVASDEAAVKDRFDKALSAAPPRPIELPSPRIPAIVGMVVGALIFAAGMLAVWLLK